MQPSKALRIQPGQATAFVGAGGKTSAIFTTARQIPGAVLVTTTTHFLEKQADWGDRRWQFTTVADFYSAGPEILAGGVHVLVGDPYKGERVSGPPQEILNAVYSFCHENALTLLIEADGSKMLPLKAPAEHEPVIPEWVNAVVVCAGLSALGKPLDSRNVHRAELFAAITGSEQGSTVTIENLERAFLSRQGGLKSIPPQARKIALFNQADTLVLQSAVLGISMPLLNSAYDAVVVSHSTSMDDHGANILDALAVHENCAGIILAAGRSARLGAAKQLLEWRGRPFLWHVVQSALQAGLNPIYVVTGAEGEKVAAAVSNLPVRIVPNPEWEQGQSTSVRAGIGNLSENIGSAVFLMSDQPQMQPTLIQSLVENHARSLSPVTAPLIDGRRGNPVLFDRITFPDLMRLEGDTGGRAIFAKYQVDYLPWNDESMLVDVDTLEDYQKFLRMDKS